MSSRIQIGARRAALAALAALALVTVATSGCETVKQTGRKALYAANPVGTADGVVVGVSRHGSYLLVSFAGSLLDMRFLAPATADCLHVLTPGSRVSYGKSGFFGRFRRADSVCDPIGVASLGAWRDRLARRHGPPVPRAWANFKLLQQDPELIFLRGRFPLASRVRIPGGYDLVAVLPNAGACTRLAQRTDASLEYRVAGPEPFALLDAGELCPVLGFALPLDPVGS